MNTIISRISELADLEKITITALERQIGASKGVLSRALSKNTDIQSKWVGLIVENYPHFNAGWLLTGKGEMLIQEEKADISINRIHNPPYREKLADLEVPLYNIDAAANLRTIFDNKNQNIIDSIKIPDLPICDGAIYIRGDSMYPLLKAGDIVIYKEALDLSYIIYGEIYLIDYTINGDDYLVCKYVKRSEIQGHIKLVSYNQHHDPMDIPITDCIRAMALVKASIRLNTMI